MTWVGCGALPEPLAGWPARRLVRLAREADRFRRVDAPRFEAIALDLGIGTRALRLLADAWAEGGAAGLAAAGVLPQDGRDTASAVTTAEAQLEGWRRRHLPLDALAVDVDGDRLTAWRLTPGEGPTAPLERVPLLQLRATLAGRHRRPRWHLHRWGPDGWWPVVVTGPGRPQSVDDCLAAVLADPLHHFWGTDGLRG